MVPTQSMLHRVRRDAVFARAALLALCVFLAPCASAADEFTAQCKQLMADIAELARETARDTGRPAFDARVMGVLASVPRHRFVPPDQVRSSYRNRPLPIGHGQTISQPYIVALMTDLLDLRADHAVLEIGTGSGYQAAVLAELAQTPSPTSRRERSFTRSSASQARAAAWRAPQGRRSSSLPRTATTVCCGFPRASCAACCSRAVRRSGRSGTPITRTSRAAKPDAAAGSESAQPSAARR